VFTARYALSPYIKQIRFVFKGIKSVTAQHSVRLPFSKNTPPPYKHTRARAHKQYFKITVFCNIMMCSMVHRYQSDFDLKMEAGGFSKVPNAGTYLPNYTASQPRNCKCSTHCCKIFRCHTHYIVYNAVLPLLILPVQGTYDVNSRLVVEDSGLPGCGTVLLGE
jgi:hypothetical protein